MTIPRLVISGSTSGVGKTSITCAIIYGLKKRGHTIQPFKVGPDYIDPSYLNSISNNETKNLDVWLMGKNELMKSFVNSSTSDISIIEGVMGYYDGFGGKTNHASTHHVATLLKSPVILVLDASKTSRSIAATALGFTKFHRNSRISGIILNKIGSKKHEILCRSALENLKIPIIGVVPKNTENILESRHLGLIPVVEQKQLQRKIKQISQQISDYLDFEKLIKICKNVQHIPITKPQKFKNVTLGNELEKTEALVEELIGEEAIGLDIETTGLDPLLDKIRLVQIATADDTYVIDLNYVPISALNPLLTSGPIKIIHNAKFDASFLYEAPGGAMPEPIYDESTIKSLDWKEHIRTRPGMYIGKLGDGSSHDLSLIHI